MDFQKLAKKWSKNPPKQWFSALWPTFWPIFGVWISNHLLLVSWFYFIFFGTENSGFLSAKKCPFWPLFDPFLTPFWPLFGPLLELTCYDLVILDGLLLCIIHFCSKLPVFYWFLGDFSQKTPFLRFFGFFRFGFWPKNRQKVSLENCLQITSKKNPFFDPFLDHFWAIFWTHFLAKIPFFGHFDPFLTPFWPFLVIFLTLAFSSNIYSPCIYFDETPKNRFFSCFFVFFRDFLRFLTTFAKTDKNRPKPDYFWLAKHQLSLPKQGYTGPLIWTPYLTPFWTPFWTISGYSEGSLTDKTTKTGGPDLDPYLDPYFDPIFDPK